MDEHQPGRRHLIGLDGPEVRIPPAIAYWLEKPLRAWLDEIRARGGSGDAIAPYIDAISDAKRWYVADQLNGSANGTGPSEDGTSAETMVETRWISTAEAAEELGCSARYVRTLAARGDLKADQSGRVWVIDAASLARHRRTAA